MLHRQNLENKIVIVTGASKGIGAAVAKGMAAAGASVVVNYLSSKEDADNVVGEITKGGGSAIAVQANVGLPADVKRLFSETLAVYGKVDVLVNNAGYYKFQPIELVDEISYNDHFNTNVLGIVLTTKEALSVFPETGGSIINMGSVVIDDPTPMQGIYAASKAEVGAFTLTMARELGPKNVRVNMINPGITETEGIHGLGMVMGTDFEKQLIDSTPLRRLGQPDDFASVVSFLASDEAAWVTGATINVSGGFTR